MNKKLTLAALISVFLLAFAIGFFPGCTNNGKTEENKYRIAVSTESEEIEMGTYQIEIPVVIDGDGNEAAGFKVIVSRVIDPDGDSATVSYGSFSARKVGTYTIYFAVEGNDAIPEAEFKVIVVDNNKPIITKFSYYDVLIAGTERPVPEFSITSIGSGSGINHSKTALTIVDSEGAEVYDCSGKDTVLIQTAGEYKYRLYAETNSGASTAEEYPLIIVGTAGVEIETDKIMYFDKPFGVKQAKPYHDGRYTLSYSTDRKYGDESGSLLITAAQWTNAIMVRFAAPYIADVSDYEYLYCNVYVETTRSSAIRTNAQYYPKFKGINDNQWQTVRLSTDDLRSDGEIRDQVRGRPITKDNVSNLLLYFFSWSADKAEYEGFDEGTKIYVSAFRGIPKDPNAIMNFAISDQGARAVDNSTGLPVDSYGGNVANGSFAGQGPGQNEVRFYLQRRPIAMGNYTLYLPKIDYREYPSVTVTIRAQDTIVMGFGSGETEKTGFDGDTLQDDSLWMTIKFVYSAQNGNMTVEFKSGEKILNTTVTSAAVISGQEQYAIYAEGGNYTTIWILPITIV